MADPPTQATPSVTVLDTPVPLSFPSILRNPGISNRFGHLHSASHDIRDRPPPKAVRKGTSKDNGGKRWIRRSDNARFVGNPHIQLATKKDYSLTLPATTRTFPEPLPAYIARSAKVTPPTGTVPVLDPASANAGRFSLSLKGMRRDLRKCGGRARFLVQDIEASVLQWIAEGGSVLSPDTGDSYESPGTEVGTTGTVREVSRTPLQLVWTTTDDAFARYVVHCVARYHQVVSFSKDVNGERLTYLLRPNVVRQDHAAAGGVDTPPATDYSSHGYSSALPETDSELPSDLSDLESQSEAGLEGVPTNMASELDAIIEAASPAPSTAVSLPGEAWSLVGDSDVEGDASGSEFGGLADSVGSLTLEDSVSYAPVTNAPEATAQPETLAVRQSPLRSRVWDHRQGRSTSSPSRSPARRAPRRTQQPLHSAPRPSKASPRSFYEYLFA